MTQTITLDVIDRPAGGARAGLRALSRMRQRPPEGCVAVLPCGTARFNPRPWPHPTLRRIAVVAAWEDPDAAQDGPFAALASGAREHWHVLGELAHVGSGPDPWGRWTPDATGARPPGADEPVLVLISGELRARYIPAFVRDGARAVAHANASPGYLGGLALASSPLNTTSCSAWRSAADSRAYAFRAGAHAEAMKRDVSRGHHRAERFLRIRPLASAGTLDGRDPFAGLLTAVAA